MRYLFCLLIITFLQKYLYSQQIDTVYHDGKIYGYGEIKNNKRIGTWCFDIYRGKCFKTITYLENNRAIVKDFKDDDCYELIYVDHRSFNSKLIPNNIFYLENTYEVIVENYNSYKCDGWQALYYPTGGISEEGYNKNGLREGKWQVWYNYGNIGNIIYYKKGKMDSVFTSFYNDRQIMSSGYYKDDGRIGLWMNYYENGKIKFEGNYCEDISPILITYDNVDSISKIFPEYINDKIFVDYVLDFKSGTWKYYSETGKLIREEFYEKGKLIKKQEF